MSTFEDLRAFQRAMDLTADIYNVTNAFPRTELYGLTLQLRRASTGVVSNIAEGQGQLTYGEWRNHLGKAQGSLHEVRAQVLLSVKLGFLPQSVAAHLQKRIRAAASELTALILWVRKREARAKVPRGIGTAGKTGNRQPAATAQIQ